MTDYSTLMDVCRFADQNPIFRAAAVRHRPTGKIYEAIWHPSANDLAYKAGHSVGSLEEGFALLDGTFVDRWTAADMAKAARGKDIGGDSIGMHANKLTQPRGEQPERDPFTISDAMEGGPADYACLLDVCRFADEVRKQPFAGAAIRFRKSGRVFTGAAHPIAADAAYSEGIRDDDYEYGFVDHAGGFFDYDTATRMAKEHGARRAESEHLAKLGLMPTHGYWNGPERHAASNPYEDFEAAVWHPKHGIHVGGSHPYVIFRAMQNGIDLSDHPKAIDGFYDRASDRFHTRHDVAKMLKGTSAIPESTDLNLPGSSEAAEAIESQWHGDNASFDPDELLGRQTTLLEQGGADIEDGDAAGVSRWRPLRKGSYGGQDWNRTVTRHELPQADRHALTGQSAVCDKRVAPAKRRTDEPDEFDEYD